MKTPLRYPGGKSRAVPKLCQWLPAEVTEYRESFLGGGSMAIEMTKRYPDISIWVNDLYKPLYLFWLALRDDGDCLLYTSPSPRDLTTSRMPSSA